MLDVRGIPKLERLFRLAAQLDVDKSDLQRYSDFVNQKIYDLLLRGTAAATANGRDIIQPYDLPITKGLQECVHEFKRINAEIDLRPVLDYLVARPPLALGLQQRDRSRTGAHLRRRERGTRQDLQGSRARSEKPSDQALGAGVRHLQSAALVPALAGVAPSP